MSFRKYLRFRLRTLLIVVCLISVPLAGLAWRRERARRQAAAVATVRELHGTVVYEPHANEDLGHMILYGDPLLPEWQKRWLGPDFFYDIVEVSQGTWTRYYFGSDSAKALHFEPADGEAFWNSIARFNRLRSLYAYGELAPPNQVREVLGNFVELRDLGINDTRLRDEDMQGLERLALLERVNLQDTQIGDETTRRLARCGNLRYLNLSRTQVTDEGLRHLATCRELEGLALGGTLVTDAGLSHLGDLTQLESLELDETEVTGAGLRHLKVLTMLRTLNLQECPIDGAGLNEISQLDQLVRLNLGRTCTPAEAFTTMSWPKGLKDLELSTTEIDDAGLEPILALRNITSVGLLWTHVTRAGHDQFCRIRPGILVWSRDTRHPETDSHGQAAAAVRDLQ